MQDYPILELIQISYFKGEGSGICIVLATLLKLYMSIEQLQKYIYIFWKAIFRWIALLCNWMNFRRRIRFQKSSSWQIFYFTFSCRTLFFLFPIFSKIKKQAKYKNSNTYVDSKRVSLSNSVIILTSIQWARYTYILQFQIGNVQFSWKQQHLNPPWF